MVEGCSHKAVVESSSLSISTVLVAQSGRVEDCGSLWHGFKSHLTPQYTHIAQLVIAIKVRQGKALFCCKECYNQYRKLNSYDPKERNRLYQKKAKYGLSEGEYKHLFIKQNNKCAICGESFDFIVPVVDHNHSTGVVRGLLCSKCNTLLGMAKDNISILENAITYLKKG